MDVDTDAISTQMRRRPFVRATGVGAALIALAGCIGGDGGNDEDDTSENPSADDDIDAVPEFFRVEDPPDAVYVPTHRESMRILDPVAAGEYTLTPMLSYPHQFWLVNGSETRSVEPENERGVHLMFTVWDEETGIVLPVDSGAQLKVFRDGGQVGEPRRPWPMLSQEMGFHFGDNVSLPTDGTYTVEVDLPPLSVRRTGDLADRFTESATATFEFVYDDEFRQHVVGGIAYLDEEYWGHPGALEPMEHAHVDGHESSGDSHEHGDDGREHESGADDHDRSDDGEDHHDHEDGSHGHVPYSSLPEVDAYPGTLLGDPARGDAVFVTTLLESGSRFVESGDERYLLVSPRTPYNRVPLADTPLRAEIDRDGDPVTDEPLELVQTIDGDLDLHYGVGLDDVGPGDTVRITVESPPQVARHQGYETAFFDRSTIELTVPGGGT